jgi:hypothetical protein
VSAVARFPKPAESVVSLLQRVLAGIRQMRKDKILLHTDPAYDTVANRVELSDTTMWITSSSGTTANGTPGDGRRWPFPKRRWKLSIRAREWRSSVLLSGKAPSMKMVRERAFLLPGHAGHGVYH